MQVTPETIKKLQQIELKMLEIFVHICQKENLQYYLLGGTLLGAVRHKGFIPWDDDIDVGMPRADYERFLLCAQKYLPEYWFLQTYKTDKEYPLPFAKMRDSRTIYKEQVMSNLKINHGVWIDIFPLDFYVPRFFWKVQLLRLLRARVSWRFVEGEKPVRHHLAKLISLALCPFWYKSVQWQDKLMHTKMVKPLTAFGDWTNQEITPTEWYGQGVEFDFEHLRVIGPEKYEKSLTNLYGDYMQLPPVEKRVVRHNPVEIKL